MNTLEVREGTDMVGTSLRELDTVRLIAASRALIRSSGERRGCSRAAIRSSERRLLPRFGGRGRCADHMAP
jgi:hypothetical protein